MEFNDNEIKDLLDLYLPSHYSVEVINRLASNGVEVNKTTVQNVRNGKKAKHRSAILAVLVAMATEERQTIAQISKQLN